MFAVVKHQQHAPVLQYIRKHGSTLVSLMDSLGPIGRTTAYSVVLGRRYAILRLATVFDEELGERIPIHTNARSMPTYTAGGAGVGHSQEQFC